MLAYCFTYQNGRRNDQRKLLRILATNLSTKRKHKNKQEVCGHVFSCIQYKSRIMVLFGYSASSTTKTDCHDIAEILLKVTLNKNPNTSNQINDTYCVFTSFAMNINAFIYNYILIRTQLSSLVKLFKFLHILCFCREYVCPHYYVQIQAKFENTKKVIRNVNQTRTTNTMAKRKRNKKTMIFT